MEPATVQILAWIALALTCFALEMFTGTFVVVWFGLGALAAAGTVFFLPDVKMWWIPWIVWAAFSIGLILASRKFASRLGAGKSVQANSDGLIGKTGYVQTNIDPAKSTGRVLIGEEDWKASSDNSIPAGTKIRVLGVRGINLLVTEEKGEN